MVHHKIFQPVLCLSIFFIAVLTANSQATRTWVSGVGDDVNPCSRTAPCKTFAGAISKTATNGEINCLDAGGYGAVTIIKSITIDCTGTFGSILASQTNGVIINFTNSTDARKAVRLRGLQISGNANGLNAVKVVAANTVSIENVAIDGFTGSGVSVEAPAQVSVINSTIRSTASAVNVFPANGSADVLVAACRLTFNTTAVTVAANSTVRISGNIISQNTTGLAGAGKIFSFGNNAIDGNTTNGAPTGPTTGPK